MNKTCRLIMGNMGQDGACLSELLVEYGHVVYCPGKHGLERASKVIAPTNFQGSHVIDALNSQTLSG